MTRHPRDNRPVGCVLAALALALTAGGCGSNRPHRTAQADYGNAPTYQLTDQNGHVASSEAFTGKVQVVTFLFPYCTSYCPLIARNLALLQRHISDGPWHQHVQLVSFNVDRAGSGPRQLRAFISQYGGQPSEPDWEFLTGTSAQIHRVVRDGFHIFYREVSIASEDAEAAREKAAGTYTPQPDAPNALADHAHVGYDIVHNDAVEIVSPDGHIVGLYDNSSQLTLRQLQNAIGAALAGRRMPSQPAS